MNILVIGGTGFIGTKLTRELAERGHTVTVLSRTAETGAQDQIRTIAGDVTDYDSIEGAFAGQDVVVNLVALSPLYVPPGGNEMHDRIHRGGTENVVAAAEAHDVHKLIQMSALGADPDGPTAYIRAKGRAEDVVRDSELDWVLVRPSVVFGDGGEFVAFTKTLTTPHVTGLPGGGATRFQPIWVGDLVPILADCIVQDEHVGEIYELGGPEVLTLAEVARQVYRAEGTSLRIIPVPMPLARVGLTIAGLVPGVPMGPDQYRSLTLDNTVAEQSLEAFDLESSDLRTLGDYLRDDATSAPKASTSVGVVDG